MTQNAPALRPVDKLKTMLNSDSVREQMNNALKDGAPLFIASIIDVFSSDLSDCTPQSVIHEALKAAVLQLPISKGLGFAYLVPYKNKGVKAAQFQIGYKGMIQLAMRSRQVKNINAGAVFEGEFVKRDKLTGEVDLSGEKKSDKEVGYFCYLELVNGFVKTEYWTKEEVIAHAKKFSQSYNSKFSAWATDFAAMATKTVIKSVFSKYAPMSVDFVTAFQADEPANAQAYDVTDVEELPPAEEKPKQDPKETKQAEDKTEPAEEMEPGFGG